MRPVLVLLSLAFALTAPPAEACTMRGPQLFRQANIAYFVGRATGDTMTVTRVVQTHSYERVGDSLAESPRTARVTVRGLVVEAGPLFGDSVQVARLERAFARQGDRRVILVEWMYDPGCQYAPRPAGWMRAGEPLAIITPPAPESEWHDGMPIFDLRFHKRDSYPHIRTGTVLDTTTVAPLLAAGQLSPKDFVTLYTHLPDSAEYHRPDSALFFRPDDQAMRRLDQWLARWEHATPAFTMLRGTGWFYRQMLPETQKRVDGEELRETSTGAP